MLNPSTLIASTSLSFSDGVLLLALVVGGALVAGLVVILARAKIGDPATDPGSVMRSWIAISLVIGLLVFCAAAFLVDDASLRSTLFGGLIASVGAAIAFYFSSKSADQARADVLNAAVTMSQGVAKPTAYSEAAPPDTTVGSPYTYRFVANGFPAPTYRLASGQLPDGLMLDTDGTLSGKPTTANKFTFQVAASNSAGAFLSPSVTITVT